VFDTKPQRILIVEDELAISKLCKRVLTNEGFEVTIVDNGKDAEESVAECQYNLLLVDIRIPAESGYDFYVWLMQEYPHIVKRVIFMTGSAMGGDIMNLLQNSGRPYLLKPFRPDELITFITDFISKSSQDWLS
jgi:DNA-binding response OmpR family regulator